MSKKEQDERTRVETAVMDHIAGDLNVSWSSKSWGDTQKLVELMHKEGFWLRISSPFLPEDEVWSATFDHHGAVGFALWRGSDADPLMAIWKAAVAVRPEVEFVRFHNFLSEKGWSCYDEIKKALAVLPDSNFRQTMSTLDHITR